MRRYFLSLFTFTFALLATATTSATAPTLEDYKVGPVSHFLDPLGDFNIEQIKLRLGGPGEQSRVKSLADRKGKAVIITFGRPGDQCGGHLGQLRDLREKVGANKVEIIAVEQNYNRPFAGVERSFERMECDGVTPAQARGRELWFEMRSRITHDQVRGNPVTWFIDPNGKVRLLAIGLLRWADSPEVVAMVEALANGDV